MLCVVVKFFRLAIERAVGCRVKAPTHLMMLINTDVP